MAMKYLVHINPPGEFYEMLGKYGNQLTLPRQRLYCALMETPLDARKEDLIVNIGLPSVKQQRFRVKSRGTRVADDSSLILDLEKGTELGCLHQKVIETLRPFIDWSEVRSLSGENKQDRKKKGVYEKYGSTHCAQFYEPRIVLARSCLATDEKTFEEFSGREWWVEEFFLSRKNRGLDRVGRFSLE